MKKIIIILLSIALIFGLTQAFNRSKINEDENSPEVTLVKYINTINKYSVEYPSNLEVREYNPDNLSIGVINDDIIDEGVDINAVTITGKPGESLDEALVAYLINMCAADGPSESFDCKTAQKIENFNSDSGIQGKLIYLNGESKNRKENIVTSLQKGPYFAFMKTTSALETRFIIVQAPVNKFANQSDGGLVRQVASSFDFLSATSSIEGYISENIKTLSPIKEQLGGNFYVTKIEAINGTGTVEYEDGHNNYIADFTYEINSSMPVIKSFIIRK